MFIKRLLRESNISAPVSELGRDFLENNNFEVWKREKIYNLLQMGL
jgi:hypothetical protein